MAETSIQWTDHTWNPLRGCTEVSPGCAHCYASAMAARFSGPGRPYEGLAYFDANRKAHWTGKVRLVEAKLTEPLRWRKPSRVFVNSMSDLFHEDVPDEWIDLVFAAMARAPHHTFQVLTKRAGRMAEYFSGRDSHLAMTRCFRNFVDYTEPAGPWPLPNVWLGVSVEDQKRADERIPHLIRCPAAVRFLSVEPMLGPIDITAGLYGTAYGSTARGRGGVGGQMITADPAPISWVICGGESGPHARPFDLAWARSLRDQCAAAGVSYFLKQYGAKPFDSASRISIDGPDSHAVAIDLKDSHGGDWDEWDPSMRVREFPRSAVAHA